MITEYEAYLRNIRKPNGDTLTELTIERYTAFLRNFLHPYPEKWNLRAKIDEYNRIPNVWKNNVHFVAFIHYLEMCDADKSLLILVNKPQNTANSISSQRFLQQKVCSRNELKKIFDTAPTILDKCIISWLYDTACRRNELMTITPERITFKDPATDMEEIKNNIWADVEIMGKGRIKRTVSLSRLSVVLYKQLCRQTPPQPKTPIFRFYSNKKGQVVLKDQDHELWRRIKRICAKAVDRELHPHCFRHTCLQHMADSGSNEIQIASYAGHRSTMTVKNYVQNSSYIGQRAWGATYRPFVDLTRYKREP